MANKVFKQAFAKDFTGINGLTSSLELDEGAVNRAVNLEYAVGNSLRGRVGFQTLGNPGFFAMFPYSYTRTQDQYDITYGATTLTTTKTTADGTTINKLIGLNQQVWVLDYMTIVATYVSGTYPFTWYTTVSGSNINFVIKANGVSILNTSLGDGISSSVSIYSLLSTIDALAQLSVSRTTRGTCPPFAVIDGNQTSTTGATVSFGLRRVITVDAGHNFSPGDIITFPTTSTQSDYSGGIVLATTATTITYVGPQVTFLDGDVVGYMGQPATAFPITTVATASSGNLSLVFPYWRLIPEGDATDTTPNFGNIFQSARTLWSTRTTSTFWAPANSVNADNCLFIAASSAQADGVTKYNDNTLTSNYPNNLIKVDGNTAVRSGLFTIDLAPSVVAAGALTGVYQYKAFIRRYDAQGNIIDGPIKSTKSLTYAAEYGSIGGLYRENTFNVQTDIQYGKSGFFERVGVKNTTESPAAGVSFLVRDNAAGLAAAIQPGDVILLTENVAQTTGAWRTGSFGVFPVGILHRTVCTFYDGTATPVSIKVADSSGYEILDTSTISTGLTIVFLRTLAGGNTFYYLVEYPISGYTNQTSFLDNVADSVLVTKAQYEEVTLGKEHNPPPQCTLVCQHQGGLVVARGPYAPNTVAFSTADGTEYFPTASNSFDAPSTQQGAITAIASDTNDRLAVFKERSYFDVTGDLDGGTFSVNVIHEGDFGITSQASIQRVQNNLFGLSKNGFVVVHDGNLNDLPFAELNTRLINQNYQFGWATAENDAFNRTYICTIPISTTGTPVTFVIDYSRDKVHTFERTYPANMDTAGGLALVGDTLYHLAQISSTSRPGVFRRLIRFNGDSPTANNGDSFIDNTTAINYVLESEPINFGEPAQLKTPIRVRLWSIPNDYVVDGWVTHATLIETACSPIASYIGGTNPGSASSTVTFSTANDIYKDVKVPNYKTHFYLIRLTTNTIRTAPFWTGYEIMFAQDYDKEDFVK